MKIDYRPEIDGLRAIAVISVIIYHAQITIYGNQILPGGYIGVDIFFVISGYLITSIILKEYKLTGNFSFSNFYQRRARRILPALFFVMLASIPLGWYFFSFTNFANFAESMLFSLLFSSNLYFHFTGIEYDSVPSIFLPLLHTWSLSIEEQYYIIFPITLLLIYKFFKKYIFHSFVLILVISLALAHFESLNNPSISFYFLHTRLWELMFGSILAYFEIEKNFKSKNLILNFFLTIIGLILIIYSMFFFNHDTLHPSIYTLVPVIGVGTIILYSYTVDSVKKILSSKLFVGIGLLSYSLYLWHYPIFAFSRTALYTQGNLFKQIIIAFVIFTLSLITFKYIEQPFRNKKNKFKKVFYYLSIAFVLIIFLSTLIILKGGFKYNIPESLDINNFDYRYKEVELYKKCHRNFDINNTFCTFGNNKSNVYLVGDSQLISIMFDLKNKLNNNNFNLTSMTKPGQVLLFNNYQNEEDKKYQTYRIEKLSEIKNSIVIIGGKYSLYENDTLINEIEFYKDFFKSLVNNNNKIILLGPIPVVDNPYNVKKMGRNKFSEFKKNGFTDQSIPLKDFYNQSENTNKFIKNILIESIFYLDLEKIFCDDKSCYSVKDKKVYLSDDDHPSIFAANLINNLLLDKILNIYKH